ncbi:methyl-accepting chemotaxis protein [Paraburkholderia sp. EG287B]|uniref:methyl-accepting chemotaxis protein n=1 Tax=Paraburkholderia sp. EG287B TaxID=3237010 RepID=UPI0034D2C764
MKNLKIGIKLWGGFCVFLLLLIFVDAVGLANLRSQHQSTDRIANVLYPKALAAVRISQLQTDQGRLALRIILSPDENERARDKVSFDQDAAGIKAQLGALDNLVGTDEGRALLAAVRSTQSDYSGFVNDAVALALGGRTQDATALLLGDRNDAQGRAEAAQRAMSQFEEAAAQKGAADAKQAYAQTSVVVWGVLALALVVGASLAWFATPSITEPLKEALSVAHRVADGDLSAPVHASSRDETGLLLAALEFMRHSLAKSVAAVRSNAQSVSIASSQIADGNADLSARTEEQAVALEETAASMTHAYPDGEAKQREREAGRNARDAGDQCR